MCAFIILLSKRHIQHFIRKLLFEVSARSDTQAQKNRLKSII